MRRLLLLLTAIAGLMTPAMAQDSIKLKVASYHAANSLFIRTNQWMFDEITKRTNGKVTFETYYGGSLLKAPDIYPGLTRGVVDIGISVPAAFNPREWGLTGITLPFITENVYAASLAWREWYEASPVVQKEFQRNNARLLFAMPAAENVLWSQKKILTAGDLKGQRIRTVLGPGEALAALGATVVAAPWTDAVDLLSRGGVDGLSTTPFEQGIKEGVTEIANFLSSGGRMGIFATVLTSINQQAWDKLPKDVQAVFLQVADEMTAKYMDNHGKEIDEAVDMLLKAKKVQVVAMDPAEEKRWEAATRETIHGKFNDYAKKVGGDGPALIRSYQELVAKHDKQHPYQTGIDRYLARKK